MIMMKMLKTLASLMFALSISACSSTPTGPVDLTKYNFPDIETVDSISNWTLDNWNAIDNRSLIVQTSPRDYYLFVLSVPNPDLRFALGVLITSSVGQVQARFDTVSTPMDPEMRSPIDKIYKLSGQAQVKEVTQQIRGES